MKTFKALSLLLSYPSEELQQAIPQIDALLHAEGLLGPKRMETLAPLLRDLARGDLYDLQERYVLLFDRSRTLSLNLFEHIDRCPHARDLPGAQARTRLVRPLTRHAPARPRPDPAAGPPVPP